MPKKKAQDSSNKPVTGQRAISSFFRKPSASQQPSQPDQQHQSASQQPAPPQASPAVIDLGADEDQPVQPRKRARYFESETSPAADEEVSKAQGLAAFALAGAATPSATTPAAAAATSNRKAPASQTRSEQAHRKAVPQQGMHQRFQNKLVLGIGNRKAGRDKDSIVAQKHTPLELQVSRVEYWMQLCQLAAPEPQMHAGRGTQEEACWRVASNRSWLYVPTLPSLAARRNACKLTILLPHR